MWKLRFSSPSSSYQEDIERLENAAFPECLSLTWTEEPKNGRWQIDALFAERPSPAELAFILPDTLTPDQVSVSAVPDVDWVVESQKGFAPFRVGRFFVTDDQHKAERRVGDVQILINAGAAFGTGHHGSTAGCLEAIDRLSKREKPQQILDLGCGSGILTIAAVKRWNAKALATDIDPVAVDVARANFASNGVAAATSTVVATGFRHSMIASGAPFDVICANILAGPLKKMAPSFPHHLQPQGRVILSGLMRHQEQQVLSTFRTIRLYIDFRIRRAEWTTLVLKHGNH